MPGEIEKVVFTMVEALWSSFKPVYILERPDKTPNRCCEARAGMLECQERSRKQFSLLWKHCGARASLFKCGKVSKGCFNRRAGAMKNVLACLSARKDRQNSFHHCGGPVKIV